MKTESNKNSASVFPLGRGGLTGACDGSDSAPESAPKGGRRRSGLKVSVVEPESPLYSYIRPGFTLKEINNEPVADTIDFHFKMAEPEVDLLFASPKGEETLFEFSGVEISDLGLTFERDNIRTCNNGCIFCFIMQQPEGMRRSLYIMDEDYRYSFTHGNFITLSNTSDEDIKRIIEQRLSPLYISVHTTNDTLRRCMLKNELLHPVIPRIRELTDNSITIHTQVVLCPGINDGEELERTITELYELYPSVETLAVAPVGLTKYRDNLTDVAIYSAEEAGAVIDLVEKYQKKFRKAGGSRFVWPADEFYTIAERAFPALSSYETIDQFENGVGMCRLLISDFNKRRKKLAKLSPEIEKAGRIVALTGSSAFPWLTSEIVPKARAAGIDIEFMETQNRFWGDTVTISGLLTGADLLEKARSSSEIEDVVVLPPNCLNGDDLFLDNMTLADFKTKLGRKVVTGSYDMVGTLIEAVDVSGNGFQKNKS